MEVVSALSISSEVSSVLASLLSPMATQPGDFQPGCLGHPRSPEPVPPLLLFQRTQGPAPGWVPLPKVRPDPRGLSSWKPAAPHCPCPPATFRQPLCCSPGTSHTLAQEAADWSPPPPPRGPLSLPSHGWAGGWAGGVAPSLLVF